jgi:hypothetical protein
VWNRKGYNDLWTDWRNGCNETIAALGDGLDDARRFRVVAEDVSDFRDASNEHVIAHKGVVPHSFEQSFLGEHLIRV